MNQTGRFRGKGATELPDRVDSQAQPLGYCVARRDNAVEMTKLDSRYVACRDAGELISIQDYAFTNRNTKSQTTYIVLVSCLLS